MQAHYNHYDYLIWKRTPTCVRRHCTSSTVKYFSRGEWTVAQKRIGVPGSRAEVDVRVNNATAADKAGS